MAKLKSAHYGKDNIRVSKIEHSENGIHNVTEMTVRVMIEGDFNEM
jgi:urate oxidase